MLRATLKSVLLSILGFALASAQCFHSSVIEPPVNCTLEHRTRCGADRRTNTGRWPSDFLVPNKTDHSNNRTIELTWKFRNGIGTDHINRLEGIQIKIYVLHSVGSSLYPDSCDRMVFNASEHQVNGAVKQRRLLNSQFQYTINCSDSRNVGRNMMISLSLLPLQKYEHQTPITELISCPLAPTTMSTQPDMLRRILNDFPDMYEHHVTAENITIEQSGEGFNVTFPIAPRHIDMPNRFDIQIPSKRITLLNITRSEVASLNYHWQNYTYTVDQIKVSAGERITISLIVWNKDGSNLILEKNYMFPQKPTTRTASSSTLKMDLKLIIGMFGLIYM